MRVARRFSRWVPATALAFGAAGVVACVGDDPAPPTAPTEDGGAGDAAPGVDASGADAAVGADASGADADADGGDAGFDGGPPIWGGALPAGTEAVLSTQGNATCSFELVSVQTSPAPPKWELYLRKKDAS